MLSTLSALMENIVETPFMAFLSESMFRYLMPLLCMIIVIRSGVSLLTFKRKPEVWAWLSVGGKGRIPVTHWENTIGRSKRADISVFDSRLYKIHAVLTRYDDDSWTISDVASQGGIILNGTEVDICELNYGDIFNLGGIDFSLNQVEEPDRDRIAQFRFEGGYAAKSGKTLIWLIIFQLVSLFRVCFELKTANYENILFGFLFLIAVELILNIITRILGQATFDIETLAFWLCTIGMLVLCSASQGSIRKECYAIGAGIVVYFAVCWALRNLERAKRVRYLAAGFGICLLAMNVIMGSVVNGARNWVYIGSFSFQPSELVKLCFIFAGASTMDRVMAKRNLFLFVVYSGIVCLCLAVISDFGAALIFFAAFLVIAFLRSGNFAGIVLMTAAAAFGVVLIIKFRPYIMTRFAAWGHVWEHANESGGYQQTRSMMCIASGGLFGLGCCDGFLKYVAASDTDLVFALVSEDWGLLTAVFMTAAPALLALFTVRSVQVARSTFYTIASCAAVSILCLQVILNVFGTVDLLPLTGVTFPFVSNGGSGMLSAWGCLAFIKAADTRLNGSIAMKRTRFTPPEEALEEDDDE